MPSTLGRNLFPSTLLQPFWGTWVECEPTWRQTLGISRGRRRKTASKARGWVQSENWIEQVVLFQTVVVAERVGFVPASRPPVNDLRTFSNTRNTRSTQTLSIRYKTGTAQPHPNQ